MNSIANSTLTYSARCWPQRKRSNTSGRMGDALKTAGLYPSAPEPIRIDRFVEKRFGRPHDYQDLDWCSGMRAGVITPVDTSRTGRPPQGRAETGLIRTRSSSSFRQWSLSDTMAGSPPPGRSVRTRDATRQSCVRSLLAAPFRPPDPDMSSTQCLRSSDFVSS
jgi:hypothetical protein